MIVLALLAACSSPPHHVSPEPPATACETGLGDRALSEAIASYVAGSGTEGVVVGIADVDGVRIEGFGVTEPGGNTAMPADAIFDIGSIQKSFRWMAIHRLATLGELDLDAPVSLDTPDLAGATYRELASHVTGLRHWNDTDFMASANDWNHLDRTYAYDDMVAFLGDTPMLAGLEPGVDLHYSNYGPLVAGEALASRYGSDIRDIVRSELLDPLQLHSTSFQDGGAEPSRLVPGFWDDAASTAHTWVDAPDDVLALSSAAGWLQYSDACDLLRYVDGIHDSSFIDHAEIRAERFDMWVADDSGGSFLVGEGGAGLFSYPPLLGGREGLWGHLGDGQHGHSSLIMHDVERGVSYVVLANVAGDTVSSDLLDPTTGQSGAWTGDGYATQFDLLNLMLGTTE